ncbi:M48 family metallopeptidase [Streptomyces sp. NBC_00328]|uniref:M48 family metallopeptidase n=1 Tax=Streptomyces sp. NBC_00328 TaxID=2903646 RepID=UPI002E2A5379|nr:M48 family metallopeptidase [Streptomyces sp. NBC_00328]
MDSVRQTPPESPLLIRWTTVAAYAVAAMVHLVTAGLFTGGVLLIVLGFRTAVQPLVGVVLLGVALLLRPRPGRLDAELPTLRHADAPALFDLVDRMADAAGVRRVDAIQLGPEFSVTVTHYGVRRKRCLVLGLPLWSAHPTRKPIAAVAHALGHLSGRDLRGDAFVGTALESLNAMARTTRTGNDAYIPSGAPAHSFHAGDVAGGASLFNARTRKGEWLLGIPRAAAAATARLLSWLILPATRRAEFDADDLAARMASTEAAVAALQDRQLARAVGIEVHRLAIATRTFKGDRSSATAAQEALWDKVARYSESLREKRGCDETTEPDGIGTVVGPAGLPSGPLRVARLARVPGGGAAITLDELDRNRIEDELRRPKQVLTRKVVRDCVPLTQ